MPSQKLVTVDDRLFTLGLTELFRGEMKHHETEKLLPLAISACRELAIDPSNAPIEGYYDETPELRDFFRRVRALQDTQANVSLTPAAAQALERLSATLNSPALGRVMDDGHLLARNSHALGEALRMSLRWEIDELVLKARSLVREDDRDLVAVAATTGDALCLLVARESLALSSDLEWAEQDDESDYRWAVSEAVAAVAMRFVDALRHSTGIALPSPERSSAPCFGRAGREVDLAGRCILLGQRGGAGDVYYHWYVDVAGPAPVVRDFWSASVWTTEAVRCLPPGSRPGPETSPPLAAPAVPPGRGASGAFQRASGWIQRLWPGGKGR
ncbi:hypothetical protein HLB44_24820 [Aquincola sp. S2]|uniref:Uncharacterized protein n=1 Tax=Pseudaquabacterium terrae TaxID=2732868 RepID=A0ABX2ENL9_9BURK|nr:hypothetical protein [Aquabacterium terrae]NRF70235.1 hypothetical protein [Aquabacterium terrae]